MMNWDDVRIVLAVARGGTFAAAARALSLDETTVARRLSRIEDTLALPIFQAQDGRRITTARGAGLVAQAERLEAEALRLENLAAGDSGEVAGSVRIAATDLMTRYILAPRIGKLVQAHPGITLRFLSGHENLSFSRWETDLAVRLARPERGDLLVRKLADIQFGVLENRTEPAPRVSDSAGRRWLSYREDLAHLPEARFVAERLDGREPVLRSNDLDALARAAAGGAGAACLPLFLAQSGGGGAPNRLAEVPGERKPNLVREVWLLMRPDQRELPAVRTVADWIVECFREKQAALAGVSSS